MFIWFFISVIIFQLDNSSNSFLILKTRETGIDVKMIPVIWIVYNIFALSLHQYLGLFRIKLEEGLLSIFHLYTSL